MTPIRGRRLVRSLCILLTTCLMLGGVAAAATQEATEGRVVDRFGRPIEGVAVRTAPDSEPVARSDADGLFPLLEGVESVWLEHPDFLPLEVTRVALLRGQVVLSRRGEIRETVLVAGSPLGDRFSPHSVVSSVVELADRVITVGTVGEAALDVAGVAQNGQGGLFQVLSIRGTSRQRVLALLGGARLTSERRAGVSASFVDPGLLGDLEVVRGPASTYYGPGALGGAFLFNPRRFERAEMRLEWGSGADDNSQLFGWGGDRWSFGIARRATGNGETPDGLRLFDQFEQVSATLQRQGTALGRHWSLLVVPSYGSDIGKPNNEEPERRTSYPRERHLLVRLAMEDPEGRSSARIWAHPQQLVTRVEEVGESLAVVESDSFDLGAAWQRRLDLGDRVSGRVGVEYFGRRGVHLEETRSRQFGDALEPNSRTVSLRDAQADELGVLGVVNGTLGSLRWESGARVTLHRQDDGGREQVEREAVTGFLGAALPLGSQVELVANVGRGVRMPTLSERYFVGTTGRGQVLGQPDLEAEESFNAELGVRLSLPFGYLLFQVFRNDVDDYIERIDLGNGTRSFRNLTSGTLEGLEAESTLVLSEAWTLQLGGHWIEGESGEGVPLADVPQAEIKTGLQWERGRWSGDLRVRWRDAKDDPGPAEVALEDAWIADAALELELREGLALTLSGRNLFDETYLPSADDLAVPARERTFGVGVRLGWR